jgi:hypothetical protein
MTLLPKKVFSLASLTILAAILFSGCGMPTRQILPVATGDTPPSGKCLIVVERRSTSIGAWVNNEVYDNDTHVGTLTSGGKLAWLRDPGPMRLSTKASIFPIQYFRVSTAQSGKRYHYTANVEFLEGPGVRHTVTPEAGPGIEYTGAWVSQNGSRLKAGYAEPTDLCKECGYGKYKPECPTWQSYQKALANVRSMAAGIEKSMGTGTNSQTKQQKKVE